MVGQGLKDGMPSSEIKAVTLSGNIVLDGATQLQQSGTYTTTGAENFAVFATAFSEVPVVVLQPTQDIGGAGVFASVIKAGSVGISGGAGHTGNYIAWGAP